MADQKEIILREGDATPKDIVLRELPVADVTTTTIWLLQGDATPKDIVLRDPTADQTAGGNITIDCNVGNAVANGVTATISLTANITIDCVVGNAVAAGIGFVPQVGIPAAVGNAVAAGTSFVPQVSLPTTAGDAAAAGVSVIPQTGLPTNLGNAVAAGVTTSFAEALYCSVGDATASGISFTPQVSVPCVVGNAVADGITADISLGTALDVRVSWAQFNPIALDVRVSWAQFNPAAMDVRVSWAQFNPAAEVQQADVYTGGKWPSLGKWPQKHETQDEVRAERIRLGIIERDKQSLTEEAAKVRRTKPRIRSESGIQKRIYLALLAEQIAALEAEEVALLARLAVLDRLIEQEQQAAIIEADIVFVMAMLAA